MQGKIAVVTAITANKDLLRETQKNEEGVDFIAFSDKPFKSRTWTYRPAYDKFNSPRRNSRIHKILIHQYVDVEYSIWMDGNIAIDVSPSQVIMEWLKDHDIALFKHPVRDCIYDEINTAIHLDKVRNKEDEVAVIQEQAKKYKNSGYPANNGLCENGVLVRRHTPQIEAFNNCWWSEWCCHSSRDQLSLKYAAHKLGITLNVITGTLPETFERRWCHPYFNYRPHN